MTRARLLSNVCLKLEDWRLRHNFRFLHHFCSSNCSIRSRFMQQISIQTNDNDHTIEKMNGTPKHSFSVFSSSKNPELMKAGDASSQVTARELILQTHLATATDNETTNFTSIVELSASYLTNGGVIAVPTDTIYGVACLAQNSSAVERIYAIKGRNQEKPIAISVAEIEDVFKWSRVTVPQALLEDLLPGPVTVVFERSPDLNPALNPYTSLVGVRIPDHTFMQRLAKQCDGPIALTSANTSGSSSCLQVKEFENLWNRLDLVVNGGILSDTEESRLGSTVVDLSVPGTYKIIRPGSAHKNTLSCLRGKYSLVERSTDSTSHR